MRRTYFYTLLILIFPLVCKCQNLNLQQLFDEVLDAKVFIYAKPLTILDFDDQKFRSLFEDYIDSLHYQQIVANIKNVDSSLWTDPEVRNQIIVGDDEPILQWEKVKFKFNNIDKKEEDHYKKEIDYYNRNPQKRLIYRVSRPVFDNKKEFAVMKYIYIRDGYGLTLYKLKNGVWEEVFTRATYF